MVGPARAISSGTCPVGHIQWDISRGEWCHCTRPNWLLLLMQLWDVHFTELPASGEPHHAYPWLKQCGWTVSMWCVEIAWHAACAGVVWCACWVCCTLCVSTRPRHRLSLSCGALWCLLSFSRSAQRGLCLVLQVLRTCNCCKKQLLSCSECPTPTCFRPQADTWQWHSATVEAPS